MKKQLFTLLTLLVLCVTGAWGDTEYKDDFNDGQVVWLSTTNVDAAITAGWMAINTTATGSVSSYSTPSTGNDLTVYRVKTWKDKHLDFYVNGVSSITFYAHNPNNNSSRTLKATVNETSTEQNAVTLCTITTSNQGSSWGSGTVNLTAENNNFVRVYADADLDVYAMSVTVPASVPNAPTFLPVSGSSISTSSAITISSTKSTSIKYQWTSEDVTLTTASEGWQNYTAPVTQSTTGTWYLHAYGINTSGNSTVSKASYTVSSKTGVTLEFGETSVDANVGGDFTEPTLTVTPNVAAVTDNITYSINAGVTGCTINASTGEVTLGSITGTVTVKATFEGDDDYMPAEASYTINLTSPLTAVGDKTWTFGSTPWTTLTDDGAINYNLTVDNMEILANADNTQKVYSSGLKNFEGLGNLTNFFSIGQARSDSRQLHIKVKPYTRITVYISRGHADNRLKVTSGSYSGTALINGIELTDGEDSYSCEYTGASDADIYIFNSGSMGMFLYAVQVEKLPGGAVEFDYAATGANAASWTKSPIAVSTNATQIDGSNHFIKSWSGDLTVTLTATNALISNVVLTYQDSGRLPSGITASDNTSLTSDGATQTWTPESTKSSVTFTLTGSPRLTKISVTYNDAVSVTIANSGYSSLGSAYGLDFANATTSTNGAAALTAFAATENTGNTVKLVSINEAPAATGVILKGTAGATYNIPVKANAAALTVTNLLHAAVTDTPIGANTSYIMKSGEFHLVTAASTVPAGKAYLQPANPGAKALTVAFADDVTGIANVNAAESVQPVKRIVNGQLVIEMNGKRYNAAGAEF